MGIRKAELAGSWYPGGKTDCLGNIEEFSNADVPCPDDAESIVGGIVPHAGWYFSGQIACNVIKRLNIGEEPDTCIIFGRHMHPGSDNIIMKEGQWATPIGVIQIDAGFAARLTDEFNFTVETDSRYEQDNTIELQLPFIKYFFHRTRIVPVSLPPKTASLEIARRVAEISKDMGRRSVVLGSTDLTHYGYNYGYTPQGVGEDAVEWVKNVNDKRIVDLMVAMDGEDIIQESLKNHNACCPGAAGAAVEAAKILGAKKGGKIAYSTSYDIRPDSSFVGYAGIVFYA